MPSNIGNLKPVTNGILTKCIRKAILDRRQWKPSSYAFHTKELDARVPKFETSITTSDLTSGKRTRASRLKEDGQTSTIYDRTTQHLREIFESNE